MTREQLIQESILKCVEEFKVTKDNSTPYKYVSELIQMLESENDSLSAIERFRFYKECWASVPEEFNLFSNI